MDVAEVKRKLESAKRKKEETESQKVKDEIADVQQRIKFNRQRQENLVNEISKLRKYKEDLLDERREAEEYKEQLGEDYGKMCQTLAEEIKKIDVEIGDKENQVLSIENSFGPDRVLLNSLIERDSPRKEKKPENQSYFPKPYWDQETIDLANSCNNDVRSIFEDVVALAKNITSFEENTPSNLTTRYLLLKKTGAKWRILANQQHLEIERTVLKRCHQILWRLKEQYVENYVDPLDTTNNRENWALYLNEAEAKLNRHARGEPDPEPKSYSTQRINFGVVVKAPTSVPVTTPTKLMVPNLGIQRPKTPPPSRIKRESEIKPKEVPNPDVLRYTKGKKVAVLAGLASKNEPIREWMERFFQFKDVRWYDRNAKVLLQTLSCKAIDLLIIFPKWYDGWKPYLNAARLSGVKAIILDNSNKHLISQKIGESVIQN